MKSFGLFLALVLGMAIYISVPAGGAPLQGNNVDAEVQLHFRAALKAQRAGRWETAAKEYHAVLRLQPRMAEAYANLGLVYYLQSQFERSARNFKRADELEPGLRGSNLFLGLDYLKLNRSQVAVPYLKRAVHDEPRNKRAALSLGTALWNSGQRLAALRRLRETARLFPRDVDVLFSLGEADQKSANHELNETLEQAGVATPLYEKISGDIYAKQGAWNRAIWHYRRASKGNPKLPGVYVGLGTVYLRLGKLPEAETEFKQELTHNPKSATALARLAEVLILDGRTERGLRVLNRAIQLEPVQAAYSLGLPISSRSTRPSVTSSQFLTNFRHTLPALEAAPGGIGRCLALAAWYAELDQPAPYQKEWKSFRTLTPHATPSDPYLQALDDYDQRNLNTAETKLLGLLEANPQNAKARYLLAKTYERLSLSVLARMFELDPNSYRVHQLLGKIYEYRWENDKALAEYRTAVRMHPALPGLHLSIGEVLWRQGQLDPALAEFKAEIQVNPYDARAYAEMGTILVKKRESGKAIPYLTRALQLQPDLLLTSKYLGIAYYQQKNYAKAEEELKKALPTDHDGSVHYLLGSVYQAWGHHKQARAEMEEARSIEVRSERHAEITNENAASLGP